MYSEHDFSLTLQGLTETHTAAVDKIEHLETILCLRLLVWLDDKDNDHVLTRSTHLHHECNASPAALQRIRNGLKKECRVTLTDAAFNKLQTVQDIYDAVFLQHDLICPMHEEYLKFLLIGDRIYKGNVIKGTRTPYGCARTFDDYPVPLTTHFNSLGNADGKQTIVNGLSKTQLMYENGILTGSMIQYQNGILSAAGCHENNERAGTWLFTDADGKVEKIVSHAAYGDKLVENIRVLFKDNIIDAVACRPDVFDTHITLKEEFAKIRRRTSDTTEIISYLSLCTDVDLDFVHDALAFVKAHNTAPHGRLPFDKLYHR